MGLQRTASNTALLLQCGRPFSDDVEIEREPPGIPARYGSAVHAILAGAAPEEACARFDVVLYRDEIEQHVARIRTAEAHWLESFAAAEGGGPMLEIGREISRALGPDAELDDTYPRNVAFDADTHVYTVESNDIIAGTYDVAYERDAPGHCLVVIDYKTGDYGDFHYPERIPQMRTLATLVGASHVAVIHAPRSAPVTIYVAKFTREMRAAHIQALTRAVSRVNDGSLRPGPECKFCPAKRSCPAFMSDVVKEANMLARRAAGAGPLIDPTDKGALHQFLSQFNKLAERAKELLRADVEAGEVIQRPDGKVLVLADRAGRKTLSMASIRAALPPAEAEAEIERLEKLGCIKQGEDYKELVAK